MKDAPDAEGLARHLKVTEVPSGNSNGVMEEVQIGGVGAGAAWVVDGAVEINIMMKQIVTVCSATAQIDNLSMIDIPV